MSLDLLKQENFLNNLKGHRRFVSFTRMTCPWGQVHPLLYFILLFYVNHVKDRSPSASGSQPHLVFSDCECKGTTFSPYAPNILATFLKVFFHGKRKALCLSDDGFRLIPGGNAEKPVLATGLCKTGGHGRAGDGGSRRGHPYLNYCIRKKEGSREKRRGDGDSRRRSEGFMTEARSKNKTPAMFIKTPTMFI